MDSRVGHCRWPARIRPARGTVAFAIGCVVLLVFARDARAGGGPPEDPGTDCGWDFLCHLMAFVEWLFCWVVTLVAAAIEAVIAAIPDDWVPALDGLAYWTGLVNEWVALDYAAGILAGYFVFVVALIIIRWLLKIIPGLGG